MSTVCLSGLLWGCGGDTGEETVVIVDPTAEEQEAALEKENESIAIESSPKPLPVPGLVLPTDPDDRRQAIASGRADPFNSVPLTAPLKPPPITPAPPESVTVEPAPEPVPAAPPSPPQPVLAQNVYVSGVVDVGGIPQVILKAPNESVARYVQAGEYVSNGQVLVKRVDVYGGTPIVVLEQVGVEVVKTVGEPIPAPSESESGEESESA